MAYIYKITNDINNKIYIGKTEFPIEKRFKEHCNDAFKDKKEKRPLYNAMKKYGVEHFHIKEIEKTNEPEKREKYWIEKLNSFKYGYNATKGGDGSAYLDYNLIYRTYKETKCIEKTAELCNCNKDSVRRVIMNLGVTQNEIKNNALLNISKPVARIDKDTNEILEVYKSTSEAEKKYPKHISAVCLGKRKTCGGYKWKFI